MNNADMTPGSVAGGSGDATTAPGLAGEVGSDAVADAGPAPVDPVRRRRRRWIWGVGLALLVGAGLGVAFVPTPYVLLEPGSVRGTQERISIEGAEVHPPGSEVLFTTVYVDRATTWGLLRGALDDAIEIHTQEEIYGTRGRDETQQINRHQMDVSKLVATMESLELLGYDATFTADGARVVEVARGSAVDGVIAPGDVILAVDGEPVALPSDLRQALEGRSPGDEVRLSVRRDGMPAGELAAREGDDDAEVEEVEVALGASPEDPAKGVLGVNVESDSPRVDSEVQVDIDSGVVSGPSAGLAWSLGIVDLLTPGDLTGGGDVAVTGEILQDGSVGQIGGVVQKVATVKRAGIDTFLYPADTPAEEQDEMRRVAGDGVELVPVATLEEAIHHLDPDLALPGA
jgi:PDZ domain-containing protein